MISGLPVINYSMKLMFFCLLSLISDKTHCLRYIGFSESSTKYRE